MITYKFNSSVFPEDFHNKLPNDLYDALEFFNNEFNNYLANNDVYLEDHCYEPMLEFYFALVEFLIITNIKNNFSIKELDVNTKLNNIHTIINIYEQLSSYILDFRNKNTFESIKFKYQSIYNSTFYYSFSDGDIDSIQKMINELRDLLTKSELFSEGHRLRLLNKLEKLQNELHKKMSNLDKFWGLIGEAGVCIGKFGVDAKPFVDLIKSILQIVWSSQAASAELPSGTSIPELK